MARKHGKRVHICCCWGYHQSLFYLPAITKPSRTGMCSAHFLFLESSSPSHSQGSAWGHDGGHPGRQLAEKWEPNKSHVFFPNAWDGKRCKVVIFLLHFFLDFPATENIFSKCCFLDLLSFPASPKCGVFFWRFKMFWRRAPHWEWSSNWLWKFGNISVVYCGLFVGQTWKTCPFAVRASFHDSLIIPQTALELNGVLHSSKKQALFHHHFLVPARVPGLVSLLFWHPVPSSFPGSGQGSGASLPTLLASCSIIILWFWLGFRGLSPYSFGILFHHHFMVPARLLGLVSLLFHHHFLVPARVPGLVSLLFWQSVPSSVPGSGWGCGACSPNSSGAEWGAQFFQETVLFHHDFLVPGILAFCSIIISGFLFGSG